MARLVLSQRIGRAVPTGPPIQALREEARYSSSTLPNVLPK